MFNSFEEMIVLDVDEERDVADDPGRLQCGYQQHREGSNIYLDYFIRMFDADGNPTTFWMTSDGAEEVLAGLLEMLQEGRL